MHCLTETKYIKFTIDDINISLKYSKAWMKKSLGLYHILKMANVNVDKILLSVGFFGRYQQEQVVYFAVGMSAVAYTILAYVFVGKMSSVVSSNTYINEFSEKYVLNHSRIYIIFYISILAIWFHTDMIIYPAIVWFSVKGVK